jgi:hypothetical protein
VLNRTRAKIGLELKDSVNPFFDVTIVRPGDQCTALDKQQTRHVATI